MKNEKAVTGIDPITYTQDENAITLTITGVAFENLKRIADGINATDWCDHDNTPLSVFQVWVGSLIDQVADDTPTFYHECSCCGIADVIADAVDSCVFEYGEGSSEYKARRKEITDNIRAQFGDNVIVVE